MKSKILFSLLLLTSNFLISCSLASAQPSNLLNGFWSTRNDEKVTVLTSGFTVPKMFYISATGLGPSNVSFKIAVDGIELLEPLLEGSFVIVEAKTVVIRPINDDTSIPSNKSEGTWKIIQQEEIPSVSYSFSSIPPNRVMLLTNFRTPQDFVFQINGIDAVTNLPCTNALISVIVDGNPISNPRTGLPVEFPLGSSVHGFGKTVSVGLRGNCTPNNGFSGFIKIRATK